MLNEQTLSKMQEMKLAGMAQLFKDLMDKPEHADLTHDEFVGLLVDAEATSRANRRLQRLLQNARLKQSACLEDLDYKQARGLHKQLVLELANCRWITNRQNVLMRGPGLVGPLYCS